MAPLVKLGRRGASLPWRALLCWRATITPPSPLSRMARIAIIALMLFAAAPALAQQSDTTAPPNSDAIPAPAGSTGAAPQAAPLPACGERSAPKAPGEGGSPRAECVENPPHPNPLPAGGERERTETPAPPPSTATDAPRSGATDTSPAAAAPPDAAPPATTEGPPAAPPPPARAGNVDVRESLCLMIESAARAQNLPLEFFARVIWQESRFQADVVGPRTRSGDRAQGIAQFMPRTAAERGLLDPFDPVQALPKSAEFLRELADQFGNLGLAAAAYNAGPGRLREFLSGRRPLPAETRNYVLAITGISVDEWASSGKREPPHMPKAGCGELMALLHRAPNPFVQKLEERVNVVAAVQQRHQLAAAGLGHMRRLALARARPLVDRDAGDGEHVVARLRRQRAAPRQELAQPSRPGVVGGGRKPEIAELVGELAQEFRRLRQRLHRIERIEQAALGGGAGHELGDALGAVAAARARADDAGLEAALLPDHAREELERQVLRPRRAFDHEAEGFAHVDIARARGRRRCGGRRLGGIGWRRCGRRVSGGRRRCFSRSGRRWRRCLGALPHPACGERVGVRGAFRRVGRRRRRARVRWLRQRRRRREQHQRDDRNAGHARQRGKRCDRCTRAYQGAPTPRSSPPVSG